MERYALAHKFRTGVIMGRRQLEKTGVHHSGTGITHSGGLWLRMEIPSDLQRVQDIEEAVLSQCQHYSYTNRDLFALKLAIDEAVANAVKHGNRGNPEKHVRIKYRVTPHRADVVVEDEGPGFNPASLPDPTQEDQLTSLHGRGILLMRAFMNNVVYSPTGNAVTLTKFNDTPRTMEHSVAFG
ncbi:MAG: ATP-binding protein [Phycisphaerae bacterium]